MPKNVVQDVIPRQKTIRNIPIHHSREGARANPPDDPDIHYESEFERPRPHHNRNRNHSRIFIWLLGVLCVAVLAFVVGNLLSGATVTITPKSQSVAINLDLIAKPDAAQGELGYTTYASTKDGDETLTATSERAVQTPATGTIIIYNNYNANAASLVKNTRFETPDGLIYRLDQPVAVPGRRIVGGQTVPGSIAAMVHADAPGEKYNIGLADFTIPGLKSNPGRYAAMYGRSKTPMTGGKIGTEKYVGDAATTEARARIDGKLTDALIQEAKAQVPVDSVFYDKAYRITFEPVTAANPSSGNGVTVRERAHFTAYFLPRLGLATAIAQNAVSGYDNAPVSALGLDTLTMDAQDNFGLGATDIGPIQFNLKGNVTIEWTVDDNKLKNDLSGANKNDLPSIAAKYPAILNANAVIRPFWSSTFPAAGKIRISIVSPSK
ncbi:hypothetical protein KGQ31_00455 [Patescibacteria group bacterium]|nr:hypothetical protein [Patescibacteria group bacterium]